MTIESDLTRRARASVANALAVMARRSGGVVDDDGTRLRYATPTRDPVLWSGALRTNPALENRVFLEAVTGFAASLGHGLTVWTWPGPDDTLETALAGAGYRDLGRSPEMVLPAPPPNGWPAVPPGVTLGPVTDDAGLRELRAVEGAAFAELDAEPSTWDAVYADLGTVVGDDVVAIVARTVDGPGAAGVGYLHGDTGELIHIGTHPAFRGRGLGSAVAVAVGAELARRGARLLTLEATPKGLPVYRKLGYRVIGSVGWWLTP